MRPPPRRPLVNSIGYDRSFVEPGPLPPHERAWRHPSELAAEERDAFRSEQPSASIRVAAMASGAVGVLMVGVLVMIASPDRGAAPIAVSATTTAPALEQTTNTRPAAVRLPVAGTATTTVPATVFVIAATPIDDGRFALVTRMAVDGAENDVLDVVTPSGRIVDGWVVDEVGDALVVELAEPEPEHGHAIAASAPADHEIVTVMSDPPRDIALADVGELEVDEGTPVLDGDGEVVGLCSHDRESGLTRLVAVSPAAATNADR